MSELSVFWLETLRDVIDVPSIIALIDTLLIRMIALLERFLAAACGDGTIRIFHTATGNLAYNLQGGSLQVPQRRRCYRRSCYLSPHIHTVLG